MAKFLSDEWFAKVKELQEEAAPLEVPPQLKGLTINLNVTTEGGTKNVHLKDGQFAQGSAPDAPVTVTLPADVAKKIFVDMDPQAGMQAFMGGQMRVDGDVTKLMVLQSVQPSEKLRGLLEDIQEITE